MVFLLRDEIVEIIKYVKLKNGGLNYGTCKIFKSLPVVVRPIF
jgi:hypothetical protein